MSELIERLRSCPELMEKMGMMYDECLYFADKGMHPIINFDNDDCPGSALFVVRGLKVLRDINLVPHLRAYNNCWWCGQDWENTALPLTPTMSQAVGEALYAVFRHDSVSNSGGAPLPVAEGDVQ